jgi:tetratricopeptide (TPR) repeat protein
MPLARVQAQQGDLGSIVGEIHVSRQGFPSQPVLVELQTRGAPITSVYTDAQGKFGFYTLPGGIYHLVIRDDAYELADERITLNPAITAVTYAQVTLYLRTGKGNTDKGQISGSNANIVDPAEYTRKFPKKAVKEYDKGVDARKNGDIEGSIKHFQTALELAADFHAAHNELGNAYLAKSDMAAAQKEYEEAIRLNQSDSEAHVNLANVLLLTGKYHEALKSVEEGLRRNPNSAVGLFVRGSVYQKVRRYSEAERSLRQALELDPKMTKIHLALVNVYLAEQKNDEAMTELKAFLKASPEDPVAAKAREMLARMEKNKRDEKSQ